MSVRKEKMPNEFICSFCNTESEDVGRLSAEQFVGHLRGTHKDDPAALTIATHIEEVYCGGKVTRSVSDLTAYQATLFIGLTQTLQPPYSDDEAFDLLAKHGEMIAERERRRFDAYATARAIREAESISTRIVSDELTTLARRAVESIAAFVECDCPDSAPFCEHWIAASVRPVENALIAARKMGRGSRCR